MRSTHVNAPRPPRRTLSIAPQVLDLVAAIPAGRVTTYGALAEAVGASPRQAAAVMANDPDASRVPWHRVVAAGGRLTIPDPRHRAEQGRRLRREGVDVTDDRVRAFRRVFCAP